MDGCYFRPVLRLKAAVTLVAAVTVTVHVALLPQPPPLQPVKFEVDDGVATRVTAVPEATVAAHRLPQSIAPSAELTLPVPLPLFATVSVTVADDAVIDWLKALELLVATDVLPEYAATIACDPAESAEVTQAATPLASAKLAQPAMAAESARKSTVPLGVPAALVTFAVKVRG